MKKRTFIAMLLCIVILIIAACSNAEDNTSQNYSFKPSLDTDEDITLTVVYSWENFEALTESIAEFNKYYPNVTINYEYLENYDTAIMNRLTSGENIDLFCIKQSFLNEDSVVPDKALDLQESGINFSDVRQELQNAFEYDGKAVAIPLMTVTYGMFVNTTLLNSLGLEKPTTLDEFLNCCEVLKNNGYTPIQGYETRGLYWGLVYNDLSARLIQTSDDKKDDMWSEINGGDKNAGEYFRETLEFISLLNEKGYIGHEENETLENGYDSVIMHFLDGESPFVFTTAETFSGSKKRESRSENFSDNPFEYEFMVTPTTNEGGYLYLNSFTSMSIYKDSPNLDYAKEFLQFLVTKDQLNSLANIKGVTSVTYDVSSDERYSSLRNIADENIYFYTDCELSSDSWGAFNLMCIDVGSGNMTVDEAVESYPEKLEEYMNKDK